MTLKDFKGKLSQANIATGAKRVALTFVVAGCLLTPVTQVAHAAVPASNILGDVQVAQDRKAIKMEDAESINNRFCGTDYQGNLLVSPEEIERAIILSDTLNGYYFDELYYTNTNRNEVLSLDIDTMYSDYERATYKGKTERFCQENMSSKPAIDAFITFSCGTLATGIKDQLIERVCNVLRDEGYEISNTPRLTINNNRLYVVVGLKQELRIIELQGESVKDIISTCVSLNSSYNTAINNIAGVSNKYEDSFAYNGVDMYTNESVWLAMPDSTKKANLTQGISLYRTLLTPEGVILESTNPFHREALSRQERRMLSSLGYTDSQIENATKSETTITLLLNQEYTK